MKIEEYKQPHEHPQAPPIIRFRLDISRYEALLIKEALWELAKQRGNGGINWDSSNDPIVVSQMRRAMEGVN